jgi:8-oxo-dGTP pyrophosphatase MutT (NUDIX family)
MSELLHRIKVFVYRAQGAEPEYLLLRGAQGIESTWGPLHGNLGFGEKLETAIRREVIEETGILRPIDLIDLEMPQHQVVGDEQVVEWAFGLRTLHTRRRLELDPRWSEFRWAQFSEGYPLLELEPDRAAFLRLHTLIRAA